MSQINGRISQIIGPVIDVYFDTKGENPEKVLPKIYEALKVKRPDGRELVIEVQQHIGEDTVRCVAMDNTDGLQRGHEIVSIIDADNLCDFDSDAFRSADVAIEFTTPTAAYGNYLRAWEQGVKVVSGSTGWLADHEADVRRASVEEISRHSFCRTMGRTPKAVSTACDCC